MKTIILIFSMLISLSGCSDDNSDKQENSLIGTWKLTGAFVVDGVSGSWKNIKNGYTYTINRNNTFSTNKYTECTSGTYSLDTVNNNIIFNYSCSNFTPCENNSSNCTEKFNLEGNYMEFTPAYLSCIEGCGEKFKKISSE